MSFYWVYDIPSWLFGTLPVLVFGAFASGGLLLTRKCVVSLIGHHKENDVVSFFMGTIGVFYGITLGLIAVGTYTTFADVDRAVSEEAASVAAIYRDVSIYPEPARSMLRHQIEAYTDYVINDSWPAQRKGIVPVAGSIRATDLQVALASFNPTTEGEKALHAETLRQFNNLTEKRRLRIQSTTSGLPSTMYIVIFLGALITIATSWLFVVENLKLQTILTTLMASLLGLLIFLIVAMDHPYRGTFSVGPDAFEIVRDQLMGPARIAPPCSGCATHQSQLITSGGK
jgi:hypothetical protein